MIRKRATVEPAPQFDARVIHSAKVLGVTPKDFIQALAGRDWEAGLNSAHRGIQLVMSITESQDQARAWLSNPHPDLGGRTPKDVILAGRGDALVTLLENALAGIPS
jgi:hypothetical protein